MNEPAQRYPLSWPAGWKRTPATQRRRAAFSRAGDWRNSISPSGQVSRVRGASRALTVADAIARVTGELERLGATAEILSTNVELRLDGLPRSGQPEPKDPGAAVYFRLTGAPRCLACDRWDRVADNIAAIAQHIDALRRIDRYGVGTMEQAFAGYAALPATTEDWWLVLGVTQDATLDDVETAFKRLARQHHPDVGGDHDRMARLSAAREVARQVLAAASNR
jgi:hypothetical protein